MPNLAEDIILELSRIAREAEAAVRKRLEAEQLGECFRDLPAPIQNVA